MNRQEQADWWYGYYGCIHFNIYIFGRLLETALLPSDIFVASICELQKNYYYYKLWFQWDSCEII